MKETPQPPLDHPYATLVEILRKAVMGTRNWDLPDQRLDREDYCGNPVSTCYLQVLLSVLRVENWPVLYEYSSPRVGNQAHLSHFVGHNFVVQYQKHGTAVRRLAADGQPADD